MNLAIEASKFRSSLLTTPLYILIGDRKNRNHRNLPKSPKSPKSPPKSPKSPLKSGVGGDMGLGGAGRGKTGYVCVKVGLVLIT